MNRKCFTLSWNLKNELKNQFLWSEIKLQSAETPILSHPLRFTMIWNLNNMWSQARKLFILILAWHRNSFYFALLFSFFLLISLSEKFHMQEMYARILFIDQIWKWKSLSLYRFSDKIKLHCQLQKGLKWTHRQIFQKTSFRLTWFCNVNEVLQTSLSKLRLTTTQIFNKWRSDT